MMYELWEYYELSIRDILDKTMYAKSTPSVKELYVLQFRYYRILNSTTHKTYPILIKPLVKTHSTWLHLSMWYAYKTFYNRHMKDVYEKTLSDRYREYKATLKLIQLELPFNYKDME